MNLTLKRTVFLYPGKICCLKKTQVELSKKNIYIYFFLSSCVSCCVSRYIKMYQTFKVWKNNNSKTNRAIRQPSTLTWVKRGLLLIQEAIWTLLFIYFFNPLQSISNAEDTISSLFLWIEILSVSYLWKFLVPAS